MKQKLIILVLLVFFSCKKETNVSVAISSQTINCAKSKSKEYTGGTVNNIYDEMTQFEDILINQEYLKNSNKESYKRLLLSLNESLDEETPPQKYISLYDRILKEVEYSSFISNAGFLLLPYDCLSESIKENEPNNVELLKQYVLLLDKPKWDSSLYFDIDFIQDLIKNTPSDKFENIAYRAPILTIMHLHLKNINRTEKSNESR